MSDHLIVLTVAAVFFGSIWGSFLNVVIYRLPKIDIAGLRKKTPHTLWYLAWPLSHCPQCKTPIPPWRNVPVFSYLLLLGRAPCCGKSIGWHYPFIELCGAGIAVVALLHFPAWLDKAAVIIFLSVLLVASAIDWRRFYLLDILTLPLLWLGLLLNIDARFALLPHAVLGAAGGYVLLSALSAVFSFFIGKRAMGAGDYKLFAAIGAWLGWQVLPMTLFLAAVAGLLLGTAKRLIRGRAIRIPFAPCLSLAAVLMLFFGDDIMLAYWRFIGG